MQCVNDRQEEEEEEERKSVIISSCPRSISLLIDLQPWGLSNLSLYQTEESRAA